MSKQRAKEKTAQVLPPLQKKENKVGRKVSTEGDTSADAGGKLSQSPPISNTKLIAAKWEKMSEPTPPPNPKPNSKPIAAKGKKISEPTPPPNQPNSKPIAAKGKKISEPKSPNPEPNSKPIAAKGKKISEPKSPNPEPNSKPIAAKGKKMSEPKSPNSETNPKPIEKISEPAPPNPEPNSKPIDAKENIFKPKPARPPIPKPYSKLIAAKGEKTSKPTPPNPEPHSKPIVAKGEKTSKPTPPPTPEPNPKPIATKERMMSEPTQPMMRECGHEAIKKKLKRVSEPLFEAANKLAGSSAAHSFRNVLSVNRSGKELHERPRSSSDITCLGRPLPDQPLVGDKLQGEQDMKVFVRTGEAVSLSSIANSGNVQLPQLFVAESNYEGPPVLDKGQVIMVVKIKTTAQVCGTYRNGKEITLSSTSSPQLSPLGEDVIVSQSLSAKDLLSHKAIPPVVAVAKQFTMSAENLVTAGTILFLQQEQPTGTNKGKKKLQPTLLARDLGGRQFKITTNCTGIFSTHPRDTALVLQEVIKHCQLPLKVCVSDSKEEVTLESVTQQQVLVAYPFNADQQSECGVFELPTEGNLQLVRVVVQSKEMEIDTQPCDAEEDMDLSHYESIDWNDGEHPQRTSPSTTQRDSVIRTLSQDLSGARGSPLGSPAQSGASAIGTSDEYNEKKAAENITYLRSLSLNEVIELLEAMQLEEYIESFKRERIDGEVLSSLTEEDLLRELTINKRLHRVRLVKVIEGIYSAREFLSQIYI